MLHARHSGHDHGGVSSDMSMGSQVYNNYDLQKGFWIFTGSFVAFATLVNIIDRIILRDRLQTRSAKPAIWTTTAWASATAIGREVFSASLPSRQIYSLKLPSVLAGPVLVVTIYIVAVTVFWFIGTNPGDPWNWEDVAVRIGCINQAQLPLLFLLAGKQSIIGWLTGLTYERINWLHRWAARIVWVGVTMHMGFFFRSWMRWNYIKVKVANDSMTQTGLAAWCILTAILLTSFAPVRRTNYELFLVLHIVLFAGLIGTAMIHVTTGTEYIWACVAIFLLDRVVRMVATFICNLGFGRVSKRWWANYATMESLPGGVTRITIDDPIVGWKPGQHMLVSCHGVVPLQSHPFTISSLPKDQKLEFLVQAQKGATKRFQKWASESAMATTHAPKMVAVEGPYGYLRPLHQFDAVVLLAGSTGSSFTVPLMRDIVGRWQSMQPVVTKTIRFVWVIKSKSCLSWFDGELTKSRQAVDDMIKNKGVSVNFDISIYVTCDKEATSQNANATIEEQSHQPTSIVTKQTFREKEAEALETEVTHESDESGSGGTCCCCDKVDDERCNQIAACNCKGSSSTQPSQESSSLPKSHFKIIAGRPRSRKIIRKALENAEGEAAVIVCGPQGLCDDVRQSVVSLSDERAVHKGTGAQGIYLHVEGFGY